MVFGFTRGGKTGGDSNPANLQTRFSLQPGHLATVHVRNDPVLNTSTNAYVLYCGADQDASYPLLWGEAKDFDRVDPAKFTLKDGGHVVYYDVDVSGCFPDCPACRR